MKKIILIIAFLNIQITVAQVIESPKDNEIFNYSGVEIAPEFPGGVNEWQKFLINNFRPPSDDNFKGGKLTIQFIVEVDGSLTNIEIVKDCGFGTAEEGLRLFQKSPKWTPAMKNGVAVRCQYTQTITLFPPQ